MEPEYIGTAYQNIDRAGRIDGAGRVMLPGRIPASEGDGALERLIAVRSGDILRDEEPYLMFFGNMGGLKEELNKIRLGKMGERLIETGIDADKIREYILRTHKKHYRIRLLKDDLEYIGAGKDVAIVGMGNFFEIWDAQRFRAACGDMYI